MTLQVSQLIIYPVKSLAGISLETSKVESRGLQHDRRWMLVNAQHGHLTQRQHPVMALLQPGIQGDTLHIRHKHKPELNISFEMGAHLSERLSVTVWDDTCEAYEVSESVSKWFGDILGISCKLVYMPDDSIRPTDQEFSATAADKVSFADGYPILIFDEASMDQLHKKSGEDIPDNRFRGNIIFKGGHAHIEDELKRFSINEIDFHGAKTCTRCIMTTIDQDTAKGGQEPLKTLATYRKIDNKIKFGQNVIPLQEGTISVGDEIAVKETTEPIAF